MTTDPDWRPFDSEEGLLAPLHWPIPRTVTVQDPFQGASEGLIDRAYAVMALCPHLTFRIVASDPARREAYLTTPHSPGTNRYLTVDDDGRTFETPGADIRARAAMCDILPKAPAAALNAACAWHDERDPEGDGFMRRWPLPNVVYVDP